MRQTVIRTHRSALAAALKISTSTCDAKGEGGMDHVLIRPGSGQVRLCSTNLQLSSDVVVGAVTAGETPFCLPARDLARAVDVFPAGEITIVADRSFASGRGAEDVADHGAVDPGAVLDLAWGDPQQQLVEVGSEASQVGDPAGVAAQALEVAALVAPAPGGAAGGAGAAVADRGGVGAVDVFGAGVGAPFDGGAGFAHR